MQLNVTLSFSRDELTRLLKSALAKRGGGSLDNVTINGNSDGTVSGYAFLRGSPSVLQVSFGHEAIVASIMEASAAEGKPIEPGSLIFTYHEGHGFGGGPSVSAKANPAKNPVAASSGSVAAGGISFPGKCTVGFSPKELTALLMDAARKSGLEPTYASLSYHEADKNASASISVKGGNVSLDPAQLNEAITEVLTARGYTVVADGFKYSYTAASFGGSGGTSVTVTVTGIPNRI